MLILFTPAFLFAVFNAPAIYISDRKKRGLFPNYCLKINEK